MESHVSAARASRGRALPSTRAAARRLYTSAGPAIAVTLAAALAATAFIANGGLQLGSTTLVEVGVIVMAAAVVAAAVVAIGFGARLHGGAALLAVCGLGGLTALSIAWSLYPADSW